MMAPFPIPPASGLTLGESLQRRGVSRRALLKYASYLGALMALPAVGDAGLRRGPRQRPPAVGDLAVVPGVHRLHGIADPRRSCADASKT